MTPDPQAGLDRRIVVRALASVPIVAGAGLAVSAAPASAAANVTPVPVMAQIRIPAGVLPMAARQAMVTRLTKVLTEVTGLTPGAAPYVTVLISEIPDGGWGVAGHGYVRSEFPELVVKGARNNPDVPK